MIAKKALEKLLDGSWGKVIKREVLEYLEDTRLKEGIETIDLTMTFDQGAKKGDAIIHIIVRLEEMSQDRLLREIKNDLAPAHAPEGGER